jgi:hypothetical protein
LFFVRARVEIWLNWPIQESAILIVSKISNSFNIFSGKYAKKSDFDPPSWTHQPFLSFLTKMTVAHARVAGQNKNSLQNTERKNNVGKLQSYATLIFGRYPGKGLQFMTF